MTPDIYTLLITYFHPTTRDIYHAAAETEQCVAYWRQRQYNIINIEYKCKLQQDSGLTRLADSLISWSVDLQTFACVCVSERQLDSIT